MADAIEPVTYLRRRDERADRPIDDVAVRGRRARAFTYARFSSPTIAEAERRLGELDGGEALLFASGSAAAYVDRPRTPRPRSDGRDRGGRLLRNGRHARRAHPLGHREGRVRPDRTAAERRRPGLARGALEPLSSRCRTSQPPPHTPARSCATRRRDAAPRPAARARLRPRRCTPRRSTSQATTTPWSARSCASNASDAARLLEFRSRTGPVPGADTAWLLLRGLDRRSRSGSRGRAETRRDSPRLATTPP